MTNKRKKLDFDLSMTMVIMQLSEGNPGALTVLMDAWEATAPYGAMLFRELERMNIRGEQIWVGYNDYCNRNIDSFVDAVQSKDIKFVDAINKVCSYSGEIAVSE